MLPNDPALNPIGQVFCRLKMLLRKAADRRVKAIWSGIGRLLDALKPGETGNCLTRRGIRAFNVIQECSTGAKFSTSSQNFQQSRL
jgi:hypothetical protein